MVRLSVGPNDATIPVLPFLDLTLRWNPGISFSLFSQNTVEGRRLLLAFILAAIVLLSWWLARCRSTIAALGLGATLGGAVGNAIDRVAYGSVIDYLDFHIFGRHFFVFNLADAAINIGVGLLLFDLAFGSGSRDDTSPSRPTAQ